MVVLMVDFGVGVDLKTQLSLKQSCIVTNTGLAKIVKTSRLFIRAPSSTETEKKSRNLKDLEYLERISKNLEQSFPSYQSKANYKT